jgi:GTP-binding protein HflX
MIRGEIEGVRKIYIEELEGLYDMDCDKGLIVTREILDIICRISGRINREISIYINRRGKVLDVAIGDSNTVSLQDLTEKRDESALSGIRCIHTHPSGSAMLSSVDVTSLVTLKLDCMTAVSVQEEAPVQFSCGFINIEDGHLDNTISIAGPESIDRIGSIKLVDIIQEMESKLYERIHDISDDEAERVILVGGISMDQYSSQESVEELKELAETAGAQVVETVIQKKSKIDNAYYIGSGKASELSLLRQSLMADTVIFDDELTGAQVRNLEETIGCKVIDRTVLILDIFAQRAKSREGKIQVELAQLKYRLPRLMGMGLVLSRTGGGIGTRGPGEKKLEIDRRHIRGRVNDIEQELEAIRKNRGIQRERRKTNEIPVVSLVGYTNAGKSTLRNKLCQMAGRDKEGVFEADMLFATLDTTTRQVTLPSGKDVLISDTVGFIRKLPHDLVEAFKSTLEETIYSNLLVHVVDASSQNAVAQIETVNGVLKEIGADNKNVILACNKIDRADEGVVSEIRSKYNNIIEISALDGTNLDTLLEMIDNELFKSFVDAELLIPYGDARVVSYLHDSKCVEQEEYREEGIYLRIRTTQDVYGRVAQYKM